MEARLLRLERDRSVTDSDWRIVNGTGVPVSQREARSASATLITSSSDKDDIIDLMTAALGFTPFYTESGWTEW